eukprot:g3087.t1
MEESSTGIILGVVFGILAVIAIAGFVYIKRRPRGSGVSKKKSKTAVAPKAHRVLRSQSVYVLSHDPNDMKSRRIINRTKVGLGLVFNEFDRDGDEKISFISVDEWNVWLLDGLAQAPAYRAAAIQNGGLAAKMDMMLCCIEYMAQEAGRREKTLKKHMTAIEDAHGDVQEISVEDAKAETERTSNSRPRDAQGRKKKDNSLMKPVEDAPDFNSWE